VSDDESLGGRGICGARGGDRLREIVDQLEGRCSLEEARQSIVRDTLRFTRRQATWFKTFADATWLEVFDRPEETARRLWSMIQS